MMKAEYSSSKGVLTLKLTGELDHDAARKLCAAAEGELCRAQPEQMIIDFSSVTFADSSAIAVVMSHSRRMEALGKSPKIAVVGASDTVTKIFSFSGLERYIERKSK